MKIPRIFVPEKGLENNVKKLLSGKQTVAKKHDIDFDSLEIEPGVRNKYSDRKHYTSFDKSVKLLKKEGYERHLYPWESFELIMSHLEGRPDKTLDTLARNILASDGEWFNVAVEREGEKLVCYVNPENLRWNKYEEKYVVDGVLKYSYKEELALGRVSSQMWTSMQYFDDDFVEFFCNRKFKNIPQEIQETTLIYLPPDYELWPIGRGNGKGLVICGYVSERISRGIKEKNENT